MEHVPVIIVGIAAVGVLVWLVWPNPSTERSPADLAEGELLDASDSQQMGLLAGLTDGDIEDAAVMRYALQRFEEIHGHKPTTRDIATVAGLMDPTKRANDDRR